MSTLLDGFRWTIVGTPCPTIDAIAISFLMLAAVLASGAWYFRRVEGFLADNI
jgi:ABC-type polysaccharide/polyol phosphate export permease